MWKNSGPWRKCEWCVLGSESFTPGDEAQGAEPVDVPDVMRTTTYAVCCGLPDDSVSPVPMQPAVELASAAATGVAVRHGKRLAEPGVPCGGPYWRCCRYCARWRRRRGCRRLVRRADVTNVVGIQILNEPVDDPTLPEFCEYPAHVIHCNALTLVSRYERDQCHAKGLSDRG